MLRTVMKRILSTMLSLILVFIMVAPAGAVQQSGENGYSGQGAPLSAEELQALVAPIALYPDALVAQILGAATFPDQVAFAANWLKLNSSLKGKALVQAVDGQEW